MLASWHLGTTIYRTLGFLALLLVMCAPVARGQEVRGVVRDSASAEPLSGVVLVLLDSAGRVLGRNLTNERGVYRIARDPAIRRMRVLRIGFRPRELPIPTNAPATTQLDVAMAAIPTLLGPVRVVENPACPRRNDTPAAFALWEQAQAALLATVVAREANPAQVVRYMFDRTLDRDHRTIVKQAIHVDSATTTQPFAASASATEFVANGFERDSSGIGIYFGPDAEVLLDDAFTSAYCFRLAEQEVDRPTQVGIEFRAAQRKRGRVDLEGAVWIDTTSRSLVDVSWRYTNLNYQTARYEPGGHVWFRGMANGSVLIDRWFIRLPYDVVALRRTRYAPPREIHERGGELGRAHWQDGQEWHASLGVLTGTVSTRGEPAAGRRVQLLDTPYEAVIDSAGRFAIANLVPGPYRIGFFDSTLATVGLLLGSGVQFSAARDSVVTIALEAPTIDDYIATVCGDHAVVSGDPVVLVRVRTQAGEPVDGATVVVRSDNGDGVVREVARGASDQRGLVHVCQAPRGTGLLVTALREGYRTGTARSRTDHDITTLDVRLEPQRPLAGVPKA